MPSNKKDSNKKDMSADLKGYSISSSKKDREEHLRRILADEAFESMMIMKYGLLTKKNKK
jgi:hypothetical protein